MQNAKVPYQEGYDFGIGVDSATGDSRQMGIVGTQTQVKSAPGGSGGFEVIKIETTKDMEDQLGISADASGGVGPFSASARFNFARDSKVQSKSISVLLTCTRLKGFTQIDKPVLDDDAAKLMANGNVSLFKERYGDYFVRGIESGGQFFGFMRIDVKSEEDYKTMESSLSGSYGPFSADVGVNMKSSLKQTNSTANIMLYYEGGFVQKKPQTPDELFQAADQWTNSVDDQSKPYNALLVPWEIANGPPPPNIADLLNQKDVLTACANLRSQVIDKMNVLDYITDPIHQSEFIFGPNDVQNLQSLFTGVSNDHDIIQKAASFAINNPKDAVEPVTYARTVGHQPNYAITILHDLPKRVDGSNKLPGTGGTPHNPPINILHKNILTKTKFMPIKH